MKTMDSNLDERQEQALLKIEHNACWLAFWGLIVVLLVQQVAFGADLDRTMGELVVLMVLSIYLSASCLREGIWSRRLRPNAKTNAVISCVVGLAFGAATFLQVYANFPDKAVGCVTAGVFAALMTGVSCFVLLCASAAAYRRRTAELEAEPDGEE